MTALQTLAQIVLDNPEQFRNNPEQYAEIVAHSLSLLREGGYATAAVQKPIDNAFLILRDAFTIVVWLCDGATVPLKSLTRFISIANEPQAMEQLYALLRLGILVLDGQHVVNAQVPVRLRHDLLRVNVATIQPKSA